MDISTLWKERFQLNSMICKEPLKIAWKVTPHHIAKVHI